MNDYKSTIIFPDEEEKKRSIKHIIDNGLQEPRRFSWDLPRIFRSVGFRGLLFGVWDCVFLAVLLSTLLWAGLFSVAYDNYTRLLYLLFFASPFMYTALHLLTTWKEIINGTYELMMTCCLSLRQLTVARMLVFGGASVMLTVLIGIIIQRLTAGGIPLLHCLGVSFSALFLFAAVQILVEWKWHAPICYIATPILWLLMSGLLAILGEKSIVLITNIPTIIFWIIAIITGFIYGLIIKQYYYNRKEGALSNAVN